MGHSPLAAVAVISLLAIAGCGGGSDPNQTGPSTDVATPIQSTSLLTPACADCGVSPSGAFTPSRGIAGAWEFSNTTEAPRIINTGDLNAEGRTIYALITNESQSAMELPIGQPAPYQTLSAGAAHQHVDLGAPAEAKPARKDGAIAMQAVPVGTQRSWSLCSTMDASGRHCLDDNPWTPTTLTTQKVIASPGLPDLWTVNVWVQDSYLQGPSGDTARAAANEALEAYAGDQGIYYSTRRLFGGEPWGMHSFPDVIDGYTRTIDIVLVDTLHLGFDGKFSTLNTLRKSYAPASNESIAIFLDAATATSGHSGMGRIKRKLAHESAHLRNFYQRQLRLLGAGYEPWLDEITSAAFEELMASRLTPGFSPSRDTHLPSIALNAGPECSITAFDEQALYCNGPGVLGAYAGFLIRNHGTQFLTNTWSSLKLYSSAAFKDGIESVGTTVPGSIRRWRLATFSGIPSSMAPAGYSYPAYRQDGWTIPAASPITGQGNPSSPVFIGPGAARGWLVTSGTDIDVPGSAVLSLLVY